MTRTAAALRKHAAGFTLTELMVTIVIGAILVSIAVASYGSQIRKSRRTEAKNTLLDLAGREERYYTVNNNYSKTPSDLGYTGAFPQTVGSGYYQINIPTATTTAYTLVAVPITPDQLKDSKCLYFSVDNTGKQSASDNTSGGGNDTTSTCW